MCLSDQDDEDEENDENDEDNEDNENEENKDDGVYVILNFDARIASAGIAKRNQLHAIMPTNTATT